MSAPTHWENNFVDHKIICNPVVEPEQEEEYFHRTHFENDP